MTDKPIFFDASGRRASRVSVAGRGLALLAAVVAIAFVTSLVIEPHASSPKLPGHLSAINPAELVRRAFDPAMMNAAARLAQEARTERSKLVRAWRAQRAKLAAKAHASPAALRPFSNRPLTIGFYLSTDELGYPDLKREASKLDWFVPAWMNLQGQQLQLAHSVDKRAIVAIARAKPNMAILPLVQNASNAVWNGPGMATLLADPLRRHFLVRGITNYIAANKFQGTVVDFEGLPESSYPALGAFLSELKRAFTPHGWLVVVASPFDDDSWPYVAYAKVADYTLLMAYDEHDDTSGAGSVAGQSWFEENLDKRMAVLSPARTIIGVGNYGYNWSEGTAEPISFQDAVIAARDSQARIAFDDQTNNPHFSYLEDDQSKHDVWFLDGVTAYNEIHAADPYQPAGYAMWKLGSEDPSIWSVLGRNYGASAPEGLRKIPTSEDVDFEGEGEILKIEAEPAPGARTLDVDKDTGDIDDESYTTLPTPYVIRQAGASLKKIAITFDDGPDPVWTPQVLDILKAKHVPATFFVIGENAEAYPDLVQRMVTEGHDIGNHTFTHPNLDDTPGPAIILELNATQRLFQALTGRSMRLFRPPYLGDAEPSDEPDLRPVQLAQNLGYITVGMHADPVDWELPGVNAILERTLAAVRAKNPDLRANIILFHDAGGDRSQTVAALPKVIDALRAQGYTFVSVAELAGMSRAQAMPPLPVTATLIMDRIVFSFLSWTGLILYYCFIAAICIGIARLVVWSALALYNRPREIRQSAACEPRRKFAVSVIIPAFNEEKVIATTVERILASEHPELSVIVVDDGSRDATAQIVQQSFCGDARVSLVQIPNGGKANALNTGLIRAKGEVIVALDADTQFASDTIPRLVRWFSNPAVGAVAGNAKVGNRINIITRWQALEYIVSQNLERRALAAVDTLTVVPGAVGAWRRSILEELGGFPASTLAEDQDLTIAVQRAGYRVLFDASAVAWTEAPATTRSFAKQRFRWAFGTLQCLWKYRDMTLNPRYGALGMIALPQAWMFQIFLTALAPVADLMLVWQLVFQTIAYLEHGAEFTNTSLYTVAVYYGVFTLVDLLSAAFGFAMERREKWSLTWWLILQRFGYRQIMYYVLVRSISTALRGRFVGWSKLERAGTVKIGYARPAH
ncbi:MAG TPA: glycosyltransferase [Rhizomicrobium sp.]|jgi:cellulose synthase/poly-beta-1,6-N-acetylglucosamine synthase-like glycosyltransferase/peptidoglycan/xylan/chitin deacetylase (PgdA/CDA1 family)/spore germination protein YaaH|nr:glycosyltransferase [Rhizomicrobium sp.]